MTPQKARKLMADFLAANNVPFTRLQAKTVSFQDLARDEAIFVKIYGWQPHEQNYELVKAFGKAQGFIAMPQ